MPHNESEGSAEQRFGRAVRATRDQRGWSQDELVRRLEDVTGMRMHQTGLARLEGGTRGIRLDEAIALAHVLGLDLGLIGQAERVPAADELWSSRAAALKSDSLLGLAELRLRDAQQELDRRKTQRENAWARFHALSAAWSAALQAGTADPDEVAKYDRWEDDQREHGRG